MEQIVLFATAWGTENGGINAFNYDLCAALGALVGAQYQVTCVVPSATDMQKKHAHGQQVRLIDLPEFGRTLRLGPELAEMVIQRVTAADGVAVRWWIGHDIITGPLAVRARTLSAGSSSAVVHHMDYEAYLPFKKRDATSDRRKIEQQRLVLGQADLVFAIGSKLSQSARQKAPHTNREIVELIPGLADISGVSLPNTFSAITFGRLDFDNDKVKQVKLAVAAFGRARGFPGDPLGADARLTVLGLSDDDTDAERRELLALAEKYSESPKGRGRFGHGPRAVAIHGWPYIDDRQRVLEHLRHQSVCLMLSLHEGFGLAGWEAIASRVPLIVSRNSGLYDTVDRTLGGVGLGCIRSLDIRGSTGDAPFQEEDIDTVAQALVEVHTRGLRAKRDAEVLATILERFCTWQHTATAVAEGCRLDVPKALASKNLERWTPDFLLSALRDSDDVVQDAARRKHLYDHLWSRLKDPIGHKRHLIIFGGVATALCGQDAAKQYAEWLSANPTAHLFVCYESGESALGRARNLDMEVLDSSNGLPSDAVPRMQVKEQRVLDLPTLIVGSTKPDQRKEQGERIHLIPLREPLTTYVMVADDDIYVTPLLRTRSSESLSFFLAPTPVQLRLDVLRYMAHHVCLLTDNPDAAVLGTRLAEAIASASESRPQPPTSVERSAETQGATTRANAPTPRRGEARRLKDFDSEISSRIGSAQRQIVIVGALAERAIPPDWPTLFARALRVNGDLKISIYLESPNNVFWRTLAMRSSDAQPNEVAGRFSTVPTIQASDLISSVRSACSAEDDQEDVDVLLQRLVISEVDIPIYTAFIRVDDAIVAVPRSHVPTPDSFADLLEDVADPVWMQAAQDIDFFQSLNDEGQYVSSPGAEKLTVYSRSGRAVHGPVHRRSLSVNPALETRVVHGFIFDRTGRILFQYRGEGAYDNRHLWDKSFGGNVDQARDLSLRDTARRELQEEVFTDLADELQLPPVIREQLSASVVVDCGEWRGGDGLMPFRDRPEWCSFLLDQCVPFLSKRILGDGSTVVERMLYVDLFAYICPKEFPSQLNAGLARQHTLCRWINFAEIKPNSDFTPDLNRYVEDLILSGKLAEVVAAVNQVWTGR